MYRKLPVEGGKAAAAKWLLWPVLILLCSAPPAVTAPTYTAIDLNPNGLTSSRAGGISGTQQVGGGSGLTTGNLTHALLWSGTPDSAVDLNPAGYTSSGISRTNGTQQVGAGGGHALLWSGTAESAVDLNPSGLSD